MKRCFSLSVILFVSYFSMQAQQIVYNNQNIVDFEWKKITERNNPNAHSRCETCYLFPNFVEGNLALKNGNRLTVKFNYNMFYNEVELIRNSDTLFIANRFDVDSINLANKVFLYTLYKSKELGVGSAFVERLSNGKVKLLLNKKTTFIPYKPAAPYTSEVDAHYEQSQSYMLKDGNNEAAIIKSKSDIYELYPDKKKEIKKFMKKNRVRFSNQQSLVKLANYLSSLA
ncbi:MAG: hypothetical protein N4A72_13950 [Bacteroidales bacterium]|nr:hypothetical protein [Bacteroidales bacterium]